MLTQVEVARGEGRSVGILGFAQLPWLVEDVFCRRCRGAGAVDFIQDLRFYSRPEGRKMGASKS